LWCSWKKLSVPPEFRSGRALVVDHSGDLN
jgi:hypothetical protein